jgi:lipopolysaccharide/colanic/teichoic acid biosynthesis glycosyltransferase
MLFKRCFDINVSLLLLILLSPLFLVLGLLIPLESRGPVFFHSLRIGLHGRTFRLFKFRTMARDAHVHRVRMINEKSSNRVVFKHKTDPRVTRLGRFLRKFSLDELPQLINVLRGDMSLIGPRPLLKEDFESDTGNSPVFQQWARDRHRLWPGLTGLWQVSGRSDLSLEESMYLDLHYVTHWSPRLELVIVLKTIPAVLAGRGAY